jgi:hypothetical protein
LPLTQLSRQGFNSYTVGWNVSGVSSVNISGIGNSLPNVGTASGVSPGKLYTLTATGCADSTLWFAGQDAALSAQWTQNSSANKTINTNATECSPGPGGSKNCKIDFNFWNSGEAGSTVNVELCKSPTPEGVLVNSLLCPPATLSN